MGHVLRSPNQQFPKGIILGLSLKGCPWKSKNISGRGNSKCRDRSIRECWEFRWLTDIKIKYIWRNCKEMKLEIRKGRSRMRKEEGKTICKL